MMNTKKIGDGIYTIYYVEKMDQPLNGIMGERSGGLMDYVIGLTVPPSSWIMETKNGG